MSNSLKRNDGRSQYELRPLSSELGLLHRTDGSAKLTANQSSIIVGIYGPSEVKVRNEQLDKSYVEVILKPLLQEGPSEREKEYFLRSIFENVIVTTLHPRTGITIVIQVLSDDGSLVSHMIQGVLLGLMDSGLPLNSLVASVSCCLNSKSEILLDPTLQEISESKASFTFCFNTNVSDSLIASKTTGSFSQNDYFNAVSVCQKASEKIFEFYRAAIEHRIR